jgi:putative 4-mercaptohistidine N1-methyltranferase
MSIPFYESESILSQYLLFHYGAEVDILPYPEGPHDSLHYPVRCVRDCVSISRLGPDSRALDLGCAVGRSSFELARFCSSVVGIDASEAFIGAARHLAETGSLIYSYAVEGELRAAATATVPPDIERERVSFQTGDALRLPPSLGSFDIVLMANLIDRLHDPRQCLQQLAGLVRPEGQLIITSPYSWSEDYTPRANWLGGAQDGHPTSFDSLKEELSSDFELLQRRNLPFLLREHARKYQWSMAEATIWRRHN